VDAQVLRGAGEAVGTHGPAGAGPVLRLALCGSVAALVLAVAVLASFPALTGDDGQSTAEATGAGARDARGGDALVLLVVIDGLGADRAFAPGAMPTLQSLARRGRSGVARVTATVPSTVSGVRTVATGRVPPAGSFLEDFGADRDPRAGIFDVAQAAGLETFVAGPSLWRDLYGHAIDRGAFVETVGHDDARVVSLAARVLRASTRGFFVVHLGAPDDAAHRYGGDSREYAQVLRQSDAALGRLVAAAGERVRLVVTSDHGVTRAGGHAGPERAAREVPVVVVGAEGGRPQLAGMRLADVFTVLCEQLTGAVAVAGPAERAPAQGGALATATAVGACAAAFALAVRVCAHASAEVVPKAMPYLLNGILWSGLGLALLGWPRAGTALALAALAGAAWIARGGPGRTALIGGLAGVTLGAVRLLDGWLLLGGGGPAPRDAVWVAPAVVVGLALGAAVGRLGSRREDEDARGPLVAGVLTGVAVASIARLLGETVSLSSIDVRWAFPFVDGVAGLSGAVGLVLLRHGAVAAACVAGALWVLRRKPWGRVGAFAAGLGGCMAGQALAGGLLLAVAGPDVDAQALALGLAVRVLMEVTSLFMAGAAVAWLGQRQRGRALPLTADSSRQSGALRPLD
jgi:hypothetical protein